MAQKRSRIEFEDELQAQQSPFVYYGTPLPPQDPDVRDDGSYAPVWKQEVRDEQGRKRLHGAFTGGFSAGYFNTVGSKEGWTPSAFVSSRSKRAKDGPAKPEQRPEDFMDDEDLAERSAAQTIETNEKFAGLGSDPLHLEQQDSACLFRCQTETIGMKLLRKMGWQAGRHLEQYTNFNPNIRVDLTDQWPEKGHNTPGGTKTMQFEKREGKHGLGYEGNGRLHPQLMKADIDASSKEQRKPGIRVGVLNDHGSDDDDPFSSGPRISFNHSISAKTKGKKRIVEDLETGNRTQHRPRKIKHVTKPDQHRPVQRLQRCHDGHLPLPGFRLITALAVIDLSDSEKYAPPTPPADWKSSKVEAASERNRSIQAYQSTSETARSSTLDSRTRANILGEEELPGKSVFDFISPVVRDRLAAASKNGNLPPGQGQRPQNLSMELSASGKHTSDTDLPIMDKGIALMALELDPQFRPFYDADETTKRLYEAFLRYSAGMQAEPPVPPASVPRTQWMEELKGFVKMTKAIKPMSSIMASRFSSAGVSRPSDDSLKQTTSLSNLPKPINPAEDAAAAGLFGLMTRSYHQFYPARLVCKRFNVKLPTHAEAEGEGEGEGEGNLVGTSTFGHDSSIRQTTELVSAEAMAQMKTQVKIHCTDASGTPGKIGGTTGDKNSFERDTEGPALVDPSHNEALEGDRPDEDVYKAIFDHE